MNIQQLRTQYEDTKTKAAVAEAEYNRLMKELQALGIPDLKAAEKELAKIDKELSALDAEQRTLLKKAEVILNESV
jgi:predicted nuclease with TOPRIM domain